MPKSVRQVPLSDGDQTESSTNQTSNAMSIFTDKMTSLMTNFQLEMTANFERLSVNLTESINKLMNVLPVMVSSVKEVNSDAILRSHISASNVEIPIQNHNLEDNVLNVGNVIQEDLNINNVNTNSTNLQQFKFKSIIPKFSNKYNPVEFISSLARIVTPDVDLITMKNIIRYSLENQDDQVWFSVIQDSFSTFNEFQDLFIKNYWSEQRQAKVRFQLFNGRYYPKNLSREAYFIRQFSIAKYLIPKIDEKELITYFSRHFDFDISKAVLNRNIKTFSEFLDLLREFDNLYAYEKGHMQNKEAFKYSGNNDNSNYVNVKQKYSRDFPQDYSKNFVSSKRNNGGNSYNRYDPHVQHSSHRDNVNFHRPAVSFSDNCQSSKGQSFRERPKVNFNAIEVKADVHDENNSFL